MSNAKQRCTMLSAGRNQVCPQHDFVHGKEAEELRSGIEEILTEDYACDHVADMTRALLRLLERVDARDSLAYLEGKRRPSRKKHSRKRAKTE